MKKIIEWIMPILLCLGFIYGRITCYGPMNDCVAAQDTESYFEAADADFPSFTFFEQMRSATLPLFYRLCNPKLIHQITVMSEPYFGSEPELVIQNGTESIIRWQTILSIGCWAAFALLAASAMEGGFAKFLITLLILGFAFVPQIADWDSILISESLSFSLFALMLGFLIKVLPGEKADNVGTWLAGIGLLLSAAAWVFTRDTNAYFIAVMAAGMILYGIIRWIRSYDVRVPSLICGFCLVGLFLFQQQTFRKSERWLLPLLNNMTANVFPYEERVEFFKEHEMPVSDELLALTGSAEYNGIYEQEEFMHWARRYGMKTYQQWLLSMPLWTVLQIWQNMDSFFETNTQPFFYGKPDEKPHWATGVGNLLHPLSSAVILIDILLLILLAVYAGRSGSRDTVRGFIFCLILFLGSGLMMCIGYLGEVRSIWRHVLGGVMPLRLCTWVLIAALFSGSRQKKAELAPEPYNSYQASEETNF